MGASPMDKIFDTAAAVAYVLIPIGHLVTCGRPFILDQAVTAVMYLTSFVLTLVGIIVCIICTWKTTILKTSDGEVPPDLFGNFCQRNSSYSSLPNSSFEEVNEIFAEGHHRAQGYHISAILYVTCLGVPKLLSVLNILPQDGEMKNLISLAESDISSTDNREERKNEIVQEMLLKVKNLHNCQHIAILGNYFFFIISLLIMVFNPASYLLTEGIPVHLNGSLWTVNCERQVAPQDDYTLMKCQSFNASLQEKHESICIVPTNIYFHNARTYITVLYLVAILLCAFNLMRRFIKLMKYGSISANYLIVVQLLQQNAHYREHKEVIDEFERELKRRVRRTLEDNARRRRPEEQPQRAFVAFNRNEQAVRIHPGVPDAA